MNLAQDDNLFANHGATLAGLPHAAIAMNPHADIDTSVRGLGYELVEVERAPGGLLRVTIDHPASVGRAITVDDCERVTRQLQHVLEVEGVAYERLEVSSPGLDRPLRTPSDYERFVGEQVEVTLKLPFQGRKRFRGELVGRDGGWRLLLADSKPVSAAKKHAASRAGQKLKAAQGAGAEEPATAGAVKVLDFSLDEVRETRLVPVIDFKGRKAAGDSAHEAGADAGMDGGRIQ